MIKVLLAPQSFYKPHFTFTNTIWDYLSDSDVSRCNSFVIETELPAVPRPGDYIELCSLDAELLLRQLTKYLVNPRSNLSRFIQAHRSNQTFAGDAFLSDETFQTVSSLNDYELLKKFVCDTQYKGLLHGLITVQSVSFAPGKDWVFVGIDHEL